VLQGQVCIGNQDWAPAQGIATDSITTRTEIRVGMRDPKGCVENERWSRATTRVAFKAGGTDASQLPAACRAAPSPQSGRRSAP
jgi:hypothetical protein